MTVSVSSGCSLFHHYHCCEAISGVPCGIKKMSTLKEFQAWNFLADIFLLVFEKSRIKRGLRCKYQFHLAVVYFTVMLSPVCHAVSIKCLGLKSFKL